MKKARFFSKLISLIIFLSLIFPSPTLAQSEWRVGNDECVGEGAFDGVATIRGFECLLQNVFNIAIPILGVAIVFMIIAGGYKLLISGGDPKNTAAGRQTITYAIMGLVLAISGWFILNLISTITGNQNILEFNLFYSG